MEPVLWTKKFVTARSGCKNYGTFSCCFDKIKKRHFPRQFLTLRTREITNMVSVVEEVIIVADQIEHCRFDGVVFFSLISILAVLMHGSRFQYPV